MEYVKHGKKQNVCKLQKSICGLIEISKSWKIRFDTTIKSYGFEQNVDESCVYKKVVSSIITSLVLYVNDILLNWKWCRLSDWRQEMNSYAISKERFEICKNYVLKIQIVRNYHNKTLVMS